MDARREVFDQCLGYKDVHLESLRRISFHGVPDGHRAIVWKLLLNYLPLKRSEWRGELSAKRRLYHEFVKELISFSTDEPDGDPFADELALGGGGGGKDGDPPAIGDPRAAPKLARKAPQLIRRTKELLSSSDSMPSPPRTPPLFAEKAKLGTPVPGRYRAVLDLDDDAPTRRNSILSTDKSTSGSLFRDTDSDATKSPPAQSPGLHALLHPSSDPALEDLSLEMSPAASASADSLRSSVDLSLSKGPDDSFSASGAATEALPELSARSDPATVEGHLLSPSEDPLASPTEPTAGESKVSADEAPPDYASARRASTIVAEEAPDHPLSTKSDSRWSEAFENEKLRDEIEKDILRTHPGLHFFQGANLEAMSRILFVYAKLNPGVRYVQGMNEILAPIFYAISSEAGITKSDAEADAFHCFMSLMSEIRDMFIMRMDHSARGINGMVHVYATILERNDPELAEHMREAGMDHQYYGIRWFTALLAREFTLPDTLALWDSFFADADRFRFMLHTCVAMTRLQRKLLLAADFAGMMACLQHYPSTDLSIILREANSIRESEAVVGVRGTTGSVKSSTRKPQPGLCTFADPVAAEESASTAKSGSSPDIVGSVKSSIFGLFR